MQRLAVWAAFALAQSGGLLAPQVAAERGFAADKREGMIEPSCEELRAMWRYTKRQSRKADVTSDFPIYPDPVPYNLWNVPYPHPERTRPAYGGYRGHIGRQRSRAPPIYGRLVHKAPAGSRFRNGMPHRAKAFEDVAHLYGTVNHQPPSSRRRVSSIRSGGGGSSAPSGANNFYQVPQAGRFQKLKELIRTERARELQEQHAIEQLVRSPPKQVTMADEMQEPPAKQFSNSLGAYQLPGKLSYDLDRIHQRPRSIARVTDAERAWTRNVYYPREYRAR